MSRLKQCPYDTAVRCKMDEGCEGCIEWARKKGYPDELMDFWEGNGGGKFRYQNCELSLEAEGVWKIEDIGCIPPRVIFRHMSVIKVQEAAIEFLLNDIDYQIDCCLSEIENCRVKKRKIQKSFKKVVLRCVKRGEDK